MCQRRFRLLYRLRTGTHTVTQYNIVSVPDAGKLNAAICVSAAGSVTPNRNDGIINYFPSAIPPGKFIGDGMKILLQKPVLLRHRLPILLLPLPVCLNGTELFLGPPQFCQYPTALSASNR